MKTTRKKLRLGRETVRVLSSADLQQVGGGTSALVFKTCTDGAGTLSARLIGCAGGNTVTCVSCVSCYCPLPLSPGGSL